MIQKHTILEASPEDASLFTEIAMISKQHWGYPEEWMALWKDDLTITEAFLEQNRGWKLLIDGQTAGYAIVVLREGNFEIEHCFILPGFIGQGAGKKLLQHIFSIDQYKGAKFGVLSDPNAVAFYQKFGSWLISTRYFLLFLQFLCREILSSHQLKMDDLGISSLRRRNWLVSL